MLERSDTAFLADTERYRSAMKRAGRLDEICDRCEESWPDYKVERVGPEMICERCRNEEAEA